MEQRQVPPVVEGEGVVGRPVLLARLQPVDAVVDAALHLHHVRHGVHRPAVLRLDLERLARRAFRLGVLVALLQAERLHSKDVRIARHRRAPVRQHARDPVAQVQRVAAQEVHQVRGLQRDGIARVVDQHRVEGPAGVVPLVAHELVAGGQQQLLARRHDRRVRARGVEGGRRVRDVLLLGQRVEQERLEQVRRHERRIGGKRGIERGERIAAIGLVLAEGGLVVLDGKVGCRRVGDIPGVTDHRNLLGCGRAPHAGAAGFVGSKPRPARSLQRRRLRTWNRV